jgi:hypothetical protein
MNRSKSSLALMVIIAIITIQWLRIRLHNRIVANPIYRHTAQQMIDLSTPICRAMLPGDTDLYVSVEPWNIARGSEGETYWELTCIDGVGNPLLRVIRDDETGEVRRFSNLHFTYGAASGARASLLTPVSAVACARSWMRTLGFRANWQSDGKTRRDGWQWHIRLFTADRQAYLNIDLKRGYLILAEITSGTAKTM